VQGDAFAAPSRLRVQVKQSLARFPAALVNSRVRNTALCDFVTRRFAHAVCQAGNDVRTGASGGFNQAKGGEMTVDAPGQHVIERTAVNISEDVVEARFTVGLPAKGRTVLGEWAHITLVDNLPHYVANALFYESLDPHAVWEHVSTVEDTASIRSQLSSSGLVSFIADGSILPRKSGASDEPLPGQSAVGFESPESLRVTFERPNHGKISGMGIPQGVSLIVGGGFHGKSTLLKACELGIYNHIPGDGREYVVTSDRAVKIRAEDGRSVEGVDISPFISNLPYKKDTTSFSSSDASGSTSQAANIQEFLEVGADTLIVDEDTCATNFMIRDERMQALVAKEKEPITPFISRIRSLANAGVSTVLVVGGSGDYFDVADSVVMLENFVPKDVTNEARQIASAHNSEQTEKHLEAYAATPFPRVPSRSMMKLLSESGGKTAVRSRSLVHFGELELDLVCVEQLGEKSQTRAISEAIAGVLSEELRSNKPLAQVLDELEQKFDQQGLDVLAPKMLLGQFARPRRFELAAAINRVRTLKVKQLK
jgi:predicted ABC-class ATPase